MLMTIPQAQMGERERSWLFTPATRTERFAKAAEIGADVLILDLEDAVAEADKDVARRNALDYLGASSSATGVVRALRVNGITTAHGIADLAAVLSGAADPDLIVLPKTESARDLVILDRLLTAARKRARLVALIESAAAIEALDTIARATLRLDALLFGAADMAADLGAEPGIETLQYARLRLVAAAAAAGVRAIDTPFFDVRNRDGLQQEIAYAFRAGFSGKAAIHPDHVQPINEAWTPSADAVARARKILEINKAGVGTIDGKMIDEAIARGARRTLAAAAVAV
jgi:(S)-citramalyl-CoA lyase